ncbi:MAG: tetratricopeptide repeat protein [Bdellovibrionota bacterium]
MNWKNSKRLKAVLGLASLSLSLSANAQNGVPQTHCETADEELVQVSKRLDDTERRSYFEQIYSDLFQIDAVRKNPPDGVSASYLARCLSIKRRALMTNLDNASGSFRTSFDVTVKLAKLHRNFGNAKQALEMYERALKMREDAYNVRMEYFYLWKEQNQQRIHSGSAKSLTSSDFKTFFEKFNELLSPILRDTQAPQDIRVQAYMERASLYAEASQWAYVIKDLEAVLALEPSNIQAREQLVLYNCSRKIATECRKHLEQYILQNPSNLASTIQLLALQYEQEDYNSVLTTSSRALKHFPDNVDILAIRGLILSQFGRGEEARAIIDAVLKKSPTNAWALRARARDLYAKAQEFQKRGLLSNALKSLEDALATMKTAGLSNERDGLDINEKMALIIYDFLRSKNFPKSEATHADARRVAELLTPIFTNASKKRNAVSLVEPYFHALELAGITNFSKPCDMLHKSNVPLTQSTRAVKACSGI